MKRMKLLGFLITCILVLFVEGGFVSTVRAGKPEGTGKLVTIYGYAKFRDDEGDAIKSDSLGQYADRNIEGEDGRDLVEITVYDKSMALHGVNVYCGKIKHPDEVLDPSDRRVVFDFVVEDNTELEGRENNEAVYQILLWETPFSTPRNLNDDGTGKSTIHLPITVKAAADKADGVEFIIDPDYDGTDPKAITQSAVDDFNEQVYGNDPIDYLDTGHYDEFGQIIYNLEFGDHGFDIDPRDRNNDGKPDTWIITAKDIPVKLSVRRFDSYNMGKNQRVWMRSEVVYLAEYSNLMFQFAVSADPFEGYPGTIQLAPVKHEVLSTLWGGIKAK